MKKLIGFLQVSFLCTVCMLSLSACGPAKADTQLPEQRQFIEDECPDCPHEKTCPDCPEQDGEEETPDSPQGNPMPLPELDEMRHYRPRRKDPNGNWRIEPPHDTVPHPLPVFP